jgi:hypothetical protein
MIRRRIKRKLDQWKVRMIAGNGEHEKNERNETKGESFLPRLGACDNHLPKQKG